jgi:CheY-like chemotaxis protein
MRFPIRLTDQRSILILHGNQAVVDALISLFKGQPVCVAGAITIEAANYLYGLLKPQLVISSVRENWLPLLNRFRSEKPATQFIGLTDSDETAQLGRSAGIENIVITDSDPESSAGGIQLCLGAWLSAPQPSGGITVLVVDDENKTLDMLSDRLSGWGYKVFTAPSGKSALRIVERDSSISMVILDMVMPEMGGLQTLKQLKAVAVGRHLDVILLSDFADREIVQQSFHFGATDFLLKPIDLDMLENTIMACVARAAFRKGPWWRRLTRTHVFA